MNRLLTNLAKEEKLGLQKEKEWALTEGKIEAFSSFYGSAINENVGNLKAMNNAILSNFYHHLKQEPEHPIGIHTLCPDDENTWYFKKKPCLKKRFQMKKHLNTQNQ